MRRLVLLLKPSVGRGQEPWSLEMHLAIVQNPRCIQYPAPRKEASRTWWGDLEDLRTAKGGRGPDHIKQHGFWRVQEMEKTRLKSDSHVHPCLLPQNRSLGATDLKDLPLTSLSSP